MLKHLFQFFFVLLLACAGEASAGEIFYCEDGRMLAVDSSNRARLAKDPCIVAWFAADAARQQKVETIAERRRAFLSAPVLPPYRAHSCWRRSLVVFHRYY